MRALDLILPILSLGICLVFVRPGHAAERPSFDRADAAVEFITTQVRAGAADVLMTAATNPGEKLYFVNAVRSLRAIDRRTPLPSLYGKAVFPAGDSYSVGGHGEPWGHVHIDFTKKDGRWYLKKIWVCR